MDSTKDLQEEFKLLVKAYNGDYSRAMSRFMVTMFDSFEALVKSDGVTPIEAIKRLDTLWRTLSKKLIHPTTRHPLFKEDGWVEYIRVRLPSVYKVLSKEDTSDQKCTKTKY